MLVATGTFPTSHEAMLAAGMLAVYLDAYMMCALAGGCVYLAARLARSALRKGGTTTVAKLVLVFGGIALMTSIALTVVAFVKQEAVPDHQPQTPAWVLAIQSLVS
jgi:acetylornithine/succinyldiaminopimelate/putrescine aminotransferase